MLASWKLFIGANGQLLAICKHISEYSRLNNPILNFLMPFLELVQPFLLSIFFFDDKTVSADVVSPHSSKSYVAEFFCLTCAFEGNVLLYMLTKECSTLDKINDRIEGSLRKFNFDFSTLKKTITRKGF